VDLVSADWLAAHLDDPELRLADCRWELLRPEGGREAYDAGHIPGAIFVDLPADLAAPVGSGPGRHPLPEPSDVATRLGDLGIGTEHLVVAYDDPRMTLGAARLWWMLDDLGHRQVAVLDGGIGAWLAAGGQLTREVPDHPQARLELADGWRRVVERNDLAARLGSLTLLDARARERYRGEVEPIDPIAGHIPTAISLPAPDLLDPDGRSLPPDEVAARFRDAAATSGDVVVACGSGVTAANLALSMRAAGLPPPILYEGSYSDWSRSGMPVATGSEPGEPPER
jgi:thiosulfate/3-mercaptopyruvate sulfurtransferase